MINNPPPTGYGRRGILFRIFSSIVVLCVVVILFTAANEVSRTCVGKHRADDTGTIAAEHGSGDVDAAFDYLRCGDRISVAVHSHTETDFTVTVIHLKTAVCQAVICACEKLRHACHVLRVVGICVERGDTQNLVMIAAYMDEKIHGSESAVGGQIEVEHAFVLVEGVVPIVRIEKFPHSVCDVCRVVFHGTFSFSKMGYVFCVRKAYHTKMRGFFLKRKKAFRVLLTKEMATI